MSLTFREKNALAKELANDIYIDKDKELLRRHFPNDKLLLRTPSESRPDLSFDILFLILDLESKESIISNREDTTETYRQSINVEIRQRTPKVIVKKKSQKNRSTQKFDGQGSKIKTLKMPTQFIQTGFTAIVDSVNSIKNLIQNQQPIK